MIAIQPYCFGESCFRYAYSLFLIPTVLAALIFLMRKDFVKFKNKKEQEEYDKETRKTRKIILISRSIIYTCLIIALASPFILKEKLVPGNLSLTIIVDNSTSFNLFDKSVVNDIYNNLKDKIPVEVRSIGRGEDSAIGDSILQNIQGDDNVLVISDGYSNRGKLLGDMISFASSLNSTINTINTKPVKSDVSVVIEGASQTILDVEEAFIVKANNVGKEIPYHITITVDDAIAVDEDSRGTKDFPIKRIFSEGYHKIAAKLTNVGEEDYFPVNNEFYKAVKVIQRPLILFVSEKNSPLEDSLNRIYNVVKASSLPDDLSKYAAVVINDIPSKKLAHKVELLNGYVSDGNGLLIIGGENSYDRDDSLRSLDSRIKVYQSLLPVNIGAGEEGEKSDINIVIVIDASQGTADHIDIEKALAISVIDSLVLENNVGVISFYSDGASRKIGLVSPIMQLKLHINETRRKIARLTFRGQSYFDYGILSAYELLKGAGGSKNIIFISDGSTTYEKLREDTRNAVMGVAEGGAKVYVVGVGSAANEQGVIFGGSSRRDDDFLSQLAILGNGIYFPADASNRLKILFGKTDKTKKETEFFNRLVILESTHFITFNLSVDAVVSGYNLVIPKSASRLLVTTNKNIPVLAVWRFGLGRVASLATDDGTKWAGEILTKENSRLITKTINWVIGDISRTKEFDVSIKDISFGKDAEINIVSSELPKKEGLSFYKRDINLYSASFTPKEAGFHEILGAVFAVNYNDEYQNLGMNQEFLNLINVSNGVIFEPDNTDDILSTIKRVSKRIKIQSTDYGWLFVSSALVIFLVEILYRRIKERNKSLALV